MTDDLIRYGTIGGAYAADPDKIASIFVEYYLGQGGSKPIILPDSLKDGIQPRERALKHIKQYIDLFRQWAYRRADGDTGLCSEIDGYIKGLYEWLKQGKEKRQLDDIEHQRLKAEKQSLTEKLHDHIPERLISGGPTSIEQRLDDIQNCEYAESYPPNPSSTWQNGEIKRLGLISEKIKLLMRLIEKLYPECAAKYHYLHYLDEIVGDIASYTGVLELSRNKHDWNIVDNNIKEYKRRFNLHLSEIKEFRQELPNKLSSDESLEDLEKVKSKPAGAGLDREGEADNNDTDGLTKAERLAYQSYEYAIQKNCELADTTDNSVYDWLKENGTPDEYELPPSCDTWKRQVRTGRKAHGTQKNTSRAGRNGCSTMNTNQIQSLSEISSRFDNEAD